MTQRKTEISDDLDIQSTGGDLESQLSAALRSADHMQDYDRGDGIFNCVPLGSCARFTCYEYDEEVRSQIYNDGNAMTLGEIVELLNDNENRKSADLVEYHQYKPRNRSSIRDRSTI